MFKVAAAAAASHRNRSILLLVLCALALTCVSFGFGTISSSASETNFDQSNGRQPILTKSLAGIDFLLGKTKNSAQLSAGANQSSEPGSFMALLSSASVIPSATFVVNNNGDTPDANLSDNVCADAAGNCTLRAAIQQANATSGTDEINFSFATTPVTIQLNASLSPAGLVISEAVTINGIGARLLTVSGNANTTSGVFNVAASATTTTSITNLTVANSGGDGINNAGRLNLTDVVVKGNGAQGIENSGRLTITRATINNNSGGGIYIAANSQPVNISNATITNNASPDHGGGIRTLATDVTLNNVTISHNSAATSGGGIYFSNTGSQGVYIRNTIIAENTAPTGNGAPVGPDVRLANMSNNFKFVSRGNNLIGRNDGETGFSVTNTIEDKVGTIAAPINPRLGPLQNNGGQTDTRALLPESPAREAGNDCVVSSCPNNQPNPPNNLLNSDQRGGSFPRLYGPGPTPLLAPRVDIGAFESFYPVPVIDSLSPNNWGAGRPAFELTVNGSNFVAESVIRWNGQIRTTTFVSNTQLKTQIAAADVAAAAQNTVTVSNPPPGGGPAEEIAFVVANCSYALNPTTQTVAPAGGSNGTSLTTPNGCLWTASSDKNWIVISNGSESGTGPGTISYSVSPNTGLERTGQITVTGGQTLTITQTNGCTYSIAPQNGSFAAAGGAGNFQVTPSDGSCPWAATTTDSWITINNGTGAGNGMVTFTVAANTGQARTGTITVNGRTFTVTQSSGCAFSIVPPASQSFPAAGGTNGIFTLNATNSNCTREAAVVSANAASWITITNGGNAGSGGTVINFTVAANTGPARDGTITVNGQVFNVTQASGCVFNLSSNSTNVSDAGGAGSVNVTAGAGCAWTAASNVPWITVTGGTPGSGNGTVNFSVQANTGGLRTGTITIAGLTFTVNQSQGCSYSLPTSSVNVSSAAAAGNTFAVNAGSGCNWTATTTASWITITNGSGSGNGTVTFSVQQNVGDTRAGTITVNGQTFTVTQASGCTFTISQLNRNFTAAGGSGNFDLTASDPGCPWTAVVNADTPPWITITNGTSGNGNKNIVYTVAANTGGQREGTIVVGGRTHTISQASGCVFTLNSSSATVSSGGGNSSFTFTASASGCEWAATKNVPWITFTGNTSGAGNGTINFTVAANTGPTRTGEITVGGKTFTVTQDNGCAFTVAPATVNSPAGGETVTFNVTTATGCTWTASTNQPTWASIASGGGSGSGSGSFNVNVSANTGPARNAAITVASGQTSASATAAITQASGCAFSIPAPANQDFPAAGGSNGTFTVNASNAGCERSAAVVSANAASWITITAGGGAGTGGTTVNFTVAANTGPARSGTITVQGQVFTVNQASGCTYSLSQNGTTFNAGGGNGSFNVTTNNQACTWTATASQPWIVINSGTPGTGSGPLSFTVQPNVSPQRTGNITINAPGATPLVYTIEQSNGCSYSLPTTSANVPAAGGTGLTFNINVGANCQWTAATTASWITITTASGSGGGAVTYTVQPNNGPQRQATITVNDNLSFTVTQASGCTYSLSSQTLTVTPAGGNFNFQVSTPNSNCQWTATTSSPWITVTNGSGTGSGSVQFTVAANVTPERTGTITITGGLTFTVTQTSGCAYSLAPSSANINESGGARSFNVVTGAGCTWTAVSNAQWITVTAGASGSGNGTVTLSIAANSDDERTGTVTVANSVGNLTFTVNQVNLIVRNTNDSGPGSLRQAVINANNMPGNDVITFLPSLTGFITLTSGEIKVMNNGSLEIRGPGAGRMTIYGNNNSRIFYSNQAVLTITDLTLTGGNGVGEGSTEFNKYGGAIYTNFGGLTLERVHLTQNKITVPLAQGSYSNGGAVYYYGGENHIVKHSTIDYNESYFGGGLFLQGGVITIENSTITGNIARRPSGATTGGEGGGIYNIGSPVTIRNVTIAGNVAQQAGASSGGGIFNIGVLNMGNSIIAENTGAEITFESGQIISSGNNLIGDSPGDSANTGSSPIQYMPSDLRDLPTRLSGLNVFGGPTPTMALMPGSPAINAGNNNLAPGATDQRGAARITDATVDIGAFEYSIQLAPSNPTLPNATLGVHHYAQLTATRINQTNPAETFEFFVVDGFLPDGLTLTQDGGLISGPPSAPGTFTFTIKAVGLDGMSGVNRYTLTVACTYSINPAGQIAPAAGGSFSVNVTTGAGCPWNATVNSSGASWLTINSGATGSGNGTVTYTVANNPGGARSGSLTIAGQTFTVTQGAGCSFGLNPTQQNFAAAGGSGNFAVTANSGCNWTATTGDSWITITGGTGTANGSVGFTVAANTGPARTGTITVGGQTFTVTQASGCAYNFAVPIARFPFTGGNNFGYLFNAGAGCTWTFEENIPWLTINPPTGSGSATITFAVQPNNGATRSGTFTVGGQTFTVTQSGKIAASDFDGDGKTDISVFRPSDTIWYLNLSQAGYTGAQFGISTDKPVPADYDGDGKSDLAVFRDGVWYILRSGNGQFIAVNFGSPGDKPVPADYDGDGKTDVAVFRPSNSAWYRLNSTDGAFIAGQFGLAEDKPVPADYDGDGKADVAVFRPSNGVWYRLNSTDGSFIAGQFGIAEDKPVPADYDGDAKTDIAVFRPSTGNWFFLLSGSGYAFTGAQFGAEGDIPAPGDYDGDGKADLVVFRNGTWYLLMTQAGFAGFNFGLTGDKPLPSAYVP
jgi:hypothetical protein